MKKSIVWFLGCVATVLVMASCGGLLDKIDELKERATTINATYSELKDGGIKVKDFDANLKDVGMVDENGKPVESFSFKKPEKEGGESVMECQEVPIDFVKISNEVGARAAAPSEYVGTWEAFVPIEDGFRKIFLDLRANGSCSIYLEYLPGADSKIRTRLETVLTGSLKINGNTYELNDIKTKKGYAKSIGQVVAELKKSSSGVLTAEFTVGDKKYSLDLFQFSRKEGNKEIYVGTKHFSKEKLGKEITFEVEGNAFTLTIPKDIELPKKFDK